MTAGRARVSVDFWVRTAPDSMAAQSTRNPDGAGIGWFDAGAPHIVKEAGPAVRDKQVLATASSIRASSVVTHVRAATSGPASHDNSHPFHFDGLVVAHNGGFGHLDRVDSHLGEDAPRVTGDSDSERFAALIARQTRRHGGDVAAGITAAASWLAANVPLYSLNTVVIADGRLWALRYPDQRALHYARRVLRPGSGAPDATWSGSSSLASHQMVADTETQVVVTASERIDGDTDWLMLMPGELVAVDRDLTINSRLALTEPPAELMQLPGNDRNPEGF